MFPSFLLFIEKLLYHKKLGKEEKVLPRIKPIKSEMFTSVPLFYIRKNTKKKRIKLCSKNTDFMRYIVRLSQSSSSKLRVYLPYLDLI